MLKINTKHQAPAVPYMAPSSPGPASRLLVLVPSLEADLTAVTRRVRELADATGSHIKFLGLCHDAVEEPGLRRRLVTMSAMVSHDHVPAESEVVLGRNWLAAVKSQCQPGDMIVCLEEQRAGMLQKPLSQVLQSDLDVPLYVLSGLYPEDDSRSNWPARAALWTGFIAIVLGFFLLQVNIYHLATDLIIVLELLSTAVELWLIWVWNNLFR